VIKDSESREAAHGLAAASAAHLVVPGMGSDHCAGLVSGSIRRLPGIADVATNIGNHRVTVHFDPARTDAAAIEAAVERAGYEVEAVEQGRSSARAPAADEYLFTGYRSSPA
jgi:Cu+-exporting ATPase